MAFDLSDGIPWTDGVRLWTTDSRGYRRECGDIYWLSPSVFGLRFYIAIEDEDYLRIGFCLDWRNPANDDLK